MKNKRIEKWRKNQLRRYAKLRNKIPYYGDGIYTFIDLCHKFDTRARHSPMHQHYCEFDIFINGRTYYVVCVSTWQKKFDDLVDSLLDQHMQHTGENRMLDVSAYLEIEKQAQDQLHQQKLEHKPYIKIKQTQNVVYVEVCSPIIFDSFEKVQLMRDIVINYVKTRDLEKFNATALGQI